MSRIKFKCDSKKEKMELGSRIHDQLAGKPDYINSNVVLNIDGPDVDLWIADDRDIDITI